MSFSMTWSDIDRSRVLQVVVRHWRAVRSGLTQQQLAARAELTQSQVSNMEHLEDTAASPRRATSRQHLLKALTWGLELPKELVDCALWLFDGQPLVEEEGRRYLRGHLPWEPAPSPNDLRKCALAVLEEVYAQALRDSERRAGPLRVFDTDDAGRLAADAALLEMEAVPGQLLLVRAVPTHLTRPPEADPLRGFLGRFPVMDADVERKRIELFGRNLRDYGVRCIHSLDSIRQALDPSNWDSQELNFRRRWLNHLLRVLNDRNHERYEIGLAEVTPDLEIEIKGTVQVMLRAARRYRNGEMLAQWGPRWLYSTDPALVLRFYLDFERYWDHCTHSKEAVTEELNRLLPSEWRWPEPPPRLQV